MKRPERITRRALAASLAAAGLSAGAAQAPRGANAGAPAGRLRLAAARIREAAVNKNVSPSFRFIP